MLFFCGMMRPAGRAIAVPFAVGPFAGAVLKPRFHQKLLKTGRRGSLPQRPKLFGFCPRFAKRGNPLCQSEGDEGDEGSDDHARQHVAGVVHADIAA